jgi:hypothetical protein
VFYGIDNIDIIGCFMGKRGWVFATLILCVFLSSILPNLSQTAKASPLTEVTIELPAEPAEVDVSPGSSGNVEVTGNVTCDKVGPDQVKVNLIGSTDMGGCSIEPPNMVFGGTSGSSETQTFVATTRVPQGTSCTTSCVLTVSGVYVQGGLNYNIAPNSISIVVMQYFKITVLNKDGVIHNAKPGKDVEFELMIYNEGNGDDILLLDFVDRSHLSDKGFNLPEPYEFSLAENSNQSVSVKIGIPDDASGNYGTQMFVLSKVSEETDTPYQVSFNIYVKVGDNIAGDLIKDYILSPFVIMAVIIILAVIMVYKFKGKEIEVGKDIED